MKIIFNTGYVFSERLWQSYLELAIKKKLATDVSKKIEHYLNCLDEQNIDEDYTKVFVDKDPEHIGFKKL